MTFKQPRSTYASFKAHWIRTSLSLHLATFLAKSVYDIPPLRNVNEVKQAFAASVYR